MNTMDIRTWRAFRNLTWFLGWITLGVSLVLQGILSPVMAGTSVVLDGYQITFLGVTYNSDQTSTWRYEVRPASATQDLSHWVLALCTTHQVLSSDPQGSIGKDPTTGLWGIKWEQPLRTTDGPRPYTFVLNGWFEVGTTQVAVKAGRDPELGTIDGPSCTSPTPSPTPTPVIEPPTPTPTPVPTEPPTPTPAPTEPPAPTPTPGIEPPAPTPTPVVYPPAPTPTPGVNRPPAPPPGVSAPPATSEVSDLLPVTGVRGGGWSVWSLLLARLSGLFMGLGLVAHVMLAWRSRSG